MNTLRFTREPQRARKKEEGQNTRHAMAVTARASSSDTCPLASHYKPVLHLPFSAVAKGPGLWSTPSCKKPSIPNQLWLSKCHRLTLSKA